MAHHDCPSPANNYETGSTRDGCVETTTYWCNRCSIEFRLKWEHHEWESDPQSKGWFRCRSCGMGSSTAENKRGMRA
jgi:DNA-directed RNA polymerase subunit RPC12/RpoP